MADNNTPLWSKGYATPEQAAYEDAEFKEDQLAWQEVKRWAAEIEENRGEKIPFTVMHDVVHDRMCQWRNQYKKKHGYPK
jgi:hypothetical protein